MDFWGGLAQKLPTGEAASKRESLRARMREQTGDLLALSHLQLYEIYAREAKRHPLLAGLFRRLSKEHAEEAAIRMELWPQPLSVLGRLQIKEGDLWEGLKNLSKFIEKQRLWIKAVRPDDKDSERVDLCRDLVLGSTIRCQLGRFAGGLEWLTEAQEEFKQLGPEAQIRENDLKDSILVGISGCLLLEYRYQDAERFIDSALVDKVFSAYQSRARQQLIASRDLLAAMPEVTRSFVLSPSSEDLWSELMDDIERCEEPGAARKVRQKILSTIRTHDANREIQALAVAVESAMKRQEGFLRPAEPPPPEAEAESAEEVDLSKVSPPEYRQELEEMRREAQASVARMKELEKGIDESVRLLFEVAQKGVQSNIAAVRKLAGEVYRVPLKYRALWLWWSTVRFVVQIVAIGYFLDKLVEHGLEKSGNFLFGILSIEPREMILTAVVLFVGFIPGHFAEQGIDAWALPRYKHLLGRIVSNRSTRLWGIYNILLQLLAQTKQHLADLEKRMQALSAESAPPV